MIDLLADARLLTVSAGSVEFAHEALLREWPRLRDWIEDDRENLRIHRNLSSAAQEWQRLGRDEGALYRGSRLAEAREWSKHTHLRPTDLETGVPRREPSVAERANVVRAAGACGSRSALLRGHRRDRRRRGGGAIPAE